MFQCKLHLYSLSIRSQIPDRMTSFLGTNQFMVHIRYARTPADLVTPHQTGVTLRRRPNQGDFRRATFNLQIGDRTQDLEICWNDFLSENLFQDSSLVPSLSLKFSWKFNQSEYGPLPLIVEAEMAKLYVWPDCKPQICYKSLFLIRWLKKCKVTHQQSIFVTL